MGGAFKSHGNCSQVAELNFGVDPHAAEKVFNELNRNITMVGLDVTREVVLTPNYIEMIKQFNEPLGDLIVDITKFYVDFHWIQERILGCVINDPLAVAYFIDRSICSGEEYYVDVFTEGKAIGMSLIDEGNFYRKNPNRLVLRKVDSKKFMRIFLSRLFKEHIKDIVTSSGSSIIVAVLKNSGVNIVTSVFSTQIFTDLLDKGISFFVVFTILKAMPNRLKLNLYREM